MNRSSKGDRATLIAIARQAMIERGLEPDFPPAAQQELAAIGGPAGATGDLRDLRNCLWASIDNDDSRDLDQLTVAEPLAGGRIRIRVAIADVDALVRKASAIDDHASANTTSVYTPAIIFPMLPEALSTGLTSLNEDQDRIAVVADMVFEGDGSLAASELYRARVRNHGKLAYRSVAAWLDGAGTGARTSARCPWPRREPPHSGPRRTAACGPAAQPGRAQPRDDRGESGLRPRTSSLIWMLDRKNRAKQLIEDFMIATNGVTAAYLESKKFPSLRRVLRSPERWDRIADLASQLGDRLPREPDAVALEAFLGRRRKADPEKLPRPLPGSRQAHRQRRVRPRSTRR